MTKGGLLRPLGPVIDYALPPRCPGCGAVQRDDRSFCLACWARLRPLAPPWCALCRRPLEVPEGADGAALCAPCMARRPAFDGLHAAFAYGDVPRALAMRLKYGRRIGLAEVMAQAMLRIVPEQRETVLLVPVPLHWTRLWGRGFNQAALLARALGRRTGLPDDPLLLRRIRRTPPLREMDPAARARAVQGAFALDPRRAARVRGARLWLVDDVYTSGATAEACIRTLRRAGAREVHVLAFARVLREGETAGG